jgi:hypothetical protein
MTPEERFVRIENALNTLAENHVRHDAEIHQLRLQHEHAGLRHEEDMRELRGMQKSMTMAVIKIADAQRQTDERLNALIDTVDKMIRHGRNGG